MHTNKTVESNGNKNNGMVLRERKRKDYAAMLNISKRSKDAKQHQPIYKQKLEESEDKSDLYNFESDSEQPSIRKKKLQKCNNSTKFQKYLKGLTRNMNKMKKNEARAINKKLNKHETINDLVENISSLCVTADNVDTDNENVEDIPPLNNNENDESSDDGSYVV